VAIEAGAGAEASFTDDAFAAAGAEVVGAREGAGVAGGAVVAGAVDVFACVRKPEAAEVAALQPSSVVIGLLDARHDEALIRALAARSITAFALELVPRVARAQRLDALSSQASLAGYKAVLIAAGALPKYIPMMITAAGTVPPARVVVLGAGVAGLQAIATARRLGAVVDAYDVRAAVKEQVASLGARFIELPATGNAEGAGGYARPLSEEEQARQREALAPYLAEADAVITTAAVPGRKAPLLIPADAVARMRHGSVIVDLAAETGGNCELTRAGETVRANGVSVIGPVNVPSSLPMHASQLFSRNIAALLDLIIDRDGALRIDLKDEVVDAMCVTHAGQSRHGLGGS
jgi:NAD(P) transhydrogenase subunit alpha